jgi:hypothetical protein
MKMSSTKDKDFKDFIISEKKKIGTGTSSTPVWVMQKAGKRVSGRRQARGWKENDFGARHRKRKLDAKRQKRGKAVNSKGGRKIQSRKGRNA